MSKRQRNHHIPRFLLNRFASRVERPKHWVWQISRDVGAQELSTRDVAVSGSFYGERSDGVEDALETVEGRFAAALAGIDDGQTLETFANDLRHFIWTMAVRTRAIRQQFAAAVDLLLEGLGAWSNTTEAGAAAIQQLRACFDEEAEKVIRKLPPHEQRLAASAIRSPVIRSLMLDQAIRYVQSNFGDLAGTMIDLLQSQGVVARSAKEGQVRGLAKLLDAGTPPDSFRPAAWHLISRDDGHFVLGDSCVIGRAADGSLGSLFKAGKRWREVYLPISPRQVLAATRAPIGLSLDVADINRASAKFALRYVYASCTGPEIDDLRAVIGTGEPLMNQDELAKITKGIEKQWSGAGE